MKMCRQYASTKTGLQNFDLEDTPRSGRPVEADKDTIEALVDANQQITRDIGERFNLTNSTVHGHSKGLGLTSQLDKRIPYVLVERNLCRQKLLQLEWDTLPHPQYSPDLAPQDQLFIPATTKFF